MFSEKKIQYHSLGFANFLRCCCDPIKDLDSLSLYKINCIIYMVCCYLELKFMCFMIEYTSNFCWWRERCIEIVLSS
jgi:hypothetical protein